MKTITHPLFIGLFSLYLAYYLLKQTPVILPEFITSYLADLLSIFIVNTSALWLLRKLKRQPNLELPWQAILLSVLLFSAYFEYYLPAQSAKFTLDPLDILCYCISGLFYYGWRKRGAIKN